MPQAVSSTAASARMRFPRIRIRFQPREIAITFGVLAGVIAFALAAQWIGPTAKKVPREAPGLLVSGFASMARMSIAYTLSLLFAVAYGFAAATIPAARRYLLPLLDVGQSIPIPALFPVVLVVFIQSSGALLGDTEVGVELACIFLIFSVQVWNLAFGVYEGLTQIPEDLRLAADAFGLDRRARFFRLLLPACAPQLISNSIASWANGWYFLTACEIVDPHHRVRGIGSYLADAVSPEFQVLRFAAGFSVVLALVLSMELLLWRPLTSWARKFRYDTASSEEELPSAVLDWWKRSLTARRLRESVVSAAQWAGRRWRRRSAPAAVPVAKPAGPKPWLGKMALLAFFGSLGFLTIGGAAAMTVALMRPWPDSSWTVPYALAKSFLRIFGAYSLTLAWTLPLALWVARDVRRDRLVTPLAEVLAAVPAVAVWPLMARVLQPVLGVNLTVVAMLMTGMQWYLLFNLIEAVKRIPADLQEAARSIGLNGVQRARRLVLPAIAPSLVTGSVTAWGGGWNALNVAERFQVGTDVYECDGIGARLLAASGDHYDPVPLALNILAMLLAVAVLNRMVWHRLYEYAESRFRMDA
ncbi:MAG: ABC transporter permease subunit [Planctomycetes bacterium]|nr:ABC transporter permease subunit [Planctomycetota bacterium]